MNQNISSIRKDYTLQQLSEQETESSPIDQFKKWWNQAIESQIEEVNAMTLATANKEGKPSARIVLLKDFNESGFVFFTNYQSKKGNDLEINPQGALVFFWKELERQIRIEGLIQKIDEKESTDYFLSRPTDSQIAAWASNQSAIINSRDALEDSFKSYQSIFEHKAITRPNHWGGYRLCPNTIEFWQGRSNRMHDRIQYNKIENQWGKVRLAP